MNKSKGFTIIELIVVIAIIAALAAIVLVNVTGYINKGKDAAMKGNLATLASTGAAYYDSIHNYTAFCTANFAAGKPIFDQTPSATGDKVCNQSATAWAACSQELVTTANYWCVDSTGTKKEVTEASCSGFAATVCP